MFQIRSGDIRVTTIGYEGTPHVVNLEELLKEVQSQQEKYIMEAYKLQGGNALKSLFEDSKRNEKTPQIINGIVQNKVDYIKALLATTIRERATATRFGKMASEIDESGEFTLTDTAWIKPTALGTFVQDVMVFGGVRSLGGETGFAGASAASSDLSIIMTELKESFSPTKIHSGDISAGITGDKINETEMEKQLVSELAKENRRKNIAILQLYTKMRNFLFMKTELTHPSQTSTRVRFSAIIIFIEILIQKIKDWMERDESATAWKEWNKRNREAKPEERTKWQGPIPVPSPSIRIERRIQKNPMGKQITVTEGYSITFENLFNTMTGKTTDDLKEVIKNIQDLYLTRHDILLDITGPGKGDVARQFFASIKDMRIPAFNMGGVNISY